MFFMLHSLSLPSSRYRGAHERAVGPALQAGPGRQAGAGAGEGRRRRRHRGRVLRRPGPSLRDLHGSLLVYVDYMAAVLCFHLLV